MSRVQPGAFDPGIARGTADRFVLRSVVPFGNDIPRFVISPAGHRNAGSAEYRLAAQQVFNPDDPLVFVKRPPDLVVSGLAGDGISVCTKVPFAGLVPVPVELPEDLAVGVLRCGGFPLRVEPGFAGDVALLSIDSFNPVIVVRCVNHRLAPGAVIGFRAYDTEFIVFPSRFGAAVDIRCRIFVQIIGNPDNLLFLVILPPDLIISVLPGRRVPVPVQVPVSCVVARFIVFPRDLTVGFVLGGHGLPVLAEPCLARDLFALVIFLADFGISVGVVGAPAIRIGIDDGQHIAEFIQCPFFPEISGGNEDWFILQPVVAGFGHPVLALVNPPDHGISAFS